MYVEFKKCACKTLFEWGSMGDVLQSDSMLHIDFSCKREGNTIPTSGIDKGLILK